MNIISELVQTDAHAASQKRITMKRYALGLIHRLTSRLAISLAFSCCLGGQFAAQADPVPFSRIVVFGDSLSDTGNFYRLTRGLVPPAHYANARFSKRHRRVVDLATHLGLPVLAESK